MIIGHCKEKYMIYIYMSIYFCCTDQNLQHPMKLNSIEIFSSVFPCGNQQSLICIFKSDFDGFCMNLRKWEKI